MAGVALTAAIPVVAAGAGDTVTAQTVRNTVEQLPQGERTITVAGTGTIYDPRTAARFDALARSQLARLSSAPVRRELEFHQLTVKGSTFFLGAADELPTAVRLLDGRLPRSCTPHRCEVVAIGGDEAALARGASSLGIVVVGRAQRTDPTVLGGDLDPGRVPLLLGGSAQRMSLLEPLALFARTYGWVTPVDVDRVIELGAPAYVQRSQQVEDTLIAKVEGAAVDSPDTQLLDEYHRASLSGRRFGLLGGTAAVLLLGFAIAAAVGLRRDHATLVAVLRRRGARVLGVVRVTALESFAACLAGAVLGAVLGAAVTAGLAQGASLPAWRTVWDALATAGLATGLLLVAAAAITVAVLLWPDGDRRVVWRTVELIGVACAGAAWLAASRGSSSLADGSDPLVVALPVLVAVVGGLVAARLWAPLARLAERAVPRRSVAGRLGLLGAIRRPLRPVVTAAFLTAAVASVVFAGAYRATLLDGSADQAAFAVPLDATITSGRDVPNPLAVTGTDRLAGLAPGVHAYGLVRSAAVIRRLDGSSTGLTFAGIDRDALPQVRRWSRVTGTSTSAAAIATKLRPSQAPDRAPGVPAGARRLSVEVTGRPAPLDVQLWLASPDGQEAPVTLRQHGTRMAGAVPHLAGPLHAVAITLNENVEYATHHQHAIGEGNTDQPVLAGTLDLGRVVVDGTSIPWAWEGWGSANARVTPDGTGLRVGFRLEGSQVVVVPGYAPPAVLPVVADPVTARSADHGRLTLSLNQTATATVQVVATVDRFPTMSGPFVLADQAAVTSLLDRADPGTGAVRELWVAAPDGSRPALERALAGPPYDQLTVTLRAPIQDRLVDDPVARGSRLLLALIAGLALLVGVVAVVLLVLGERRDDAGELHAWEADGVRPAALRRMLFLRGLSVIAVALPLGLATGLVLARLGATLVAVDAAGVAPVPPLRVSIGALWTAVLLFAGIGLAVIVAWAVAARMLRERLPAPPDVDLQ